MHDFPLTSHTARFLGHHVAATASHTTRVEQDAINRKSRGHASAECDKNENMAG